MNPWPNWPYDYSWFALGEFALLLPVSAILALVLTRRVIRSGKRFAGTALFLTVPIPFLTGLAGGLWQLLRAFDNQRPWHQSAFDESMTFVLFNLMIGMLLTMPIYLLAVIVEFRQAFDEQSEV